MNTDAGLLTVVVPVYNRASLLAELLESIRRQDVRGFELIVVDNGSTDESLEVARAWAAANADIRTRVVEEHRRGGAAARARGLDEVRTDWTLFFDSDDLMLPTHIGRVLEAIALHPDVSLIGWPVRVAGGIVNSYPFAAPVTFWDNVINGMLATQRYCARTDLFRRAGNWNPHIGLWDDIELGVRLLNLGPRILRMDGPPGVVVRFGGSGITGDTYTSRLERMEPALQEMERTLPSRFRFLTDIKRAQIYGGAAREGNENASILQKELLGRTRGILHRMGLKIIYTAVLKGIRGSYLVFKPFYDR
ncbi:MAG: glycosyltransferase family 2 protein [Muribaculaceae bacterium]|nr:glycosyltransferase family 2 protein [Muribaculaceae bacterium]